MNTTRAMEERGGGDAFLQALGEQIEAERMIEPGERWLLAVSGGSDSMALLHGLMRLLPELAGLRGLHVAHLNHQLRAAESQGDADFVVEQCQTLGLPVTLGSVDVAAEARASAESLETAAREARYRFLAATAHDHGCRKIALGHHADDQVETILHRIIRGTGIRGLAGMSAVRPLPLPDDQGLSLVRPMLQIRRQDILNYLETNKIDFRTDSSNASRDYTRNRLRHELFPLLKKEYNPQIFEAIRQLGQLADWTGEFLGKEAAKALPMLIMEQSENVLHLDAVKLAAKSQMEQAEIIRLALSSLATPQRKMGYKQIVQVLKLVAEDRQTKQVAPLPYGLQASRQDAALILSRKATDLGAMPTKVLLQIPGQTELSPVYLMAHSGPMPAQAAGRICTEVIEAGEELEKEFRRTKGDSEEMLDLERVTGPLHLRCRREGDRFWPLGSPGKKKLGDFFTDAKVPQPLRDRVGLVCDDEGIIWVLGRRIAQRVRVDSRTRRILRIRVAYGENRL